MRNRFKSTSSIVKSLCLFISTITLLSGCNTEQPKVEKSYAPMVKIVSVNALSRGSIRQFPAQVEANKDSHLAFRVSGELTKFVVKAGNHVKRGQLLAKLDDRDFNIQLNDRKARHALAKSQFERTKQLLDRKLASQSQFDESQANLLVAQANLNSAKTALEYTSLYAPYDGIIAKVYAENLQNVQAQQVILNMQNVDSVDVSIQLPERLVAIIDKKTVYSPTVIFDSLPNKKFTVKVKEWDAQADAATRTFKVVFTLQLTGKDNILPGMSGTLFADLAIVTSQDYSQVVVPVSAVFAADDKQSKQQKRFVWVVDSAMKVSSRAVEVGSLSGEGIVIKSGLIGDEKIVGAGAHYLSEGDVVRAWSRERGL
jgi:RND family efflux transporter MFP subunit